MLLMARELFDTCESMGKSFFFIATSDTHLLSDFGDTSTAEDVV